MNNILKCMYDSGLSQWHGVRFVVLMAGIASIQSVASGQGSATIGQTTIEINSARPLAAALDRLQQLLRTPINYEETAYENAADLTRTTTVTHPGLKPTIIPRGGRFSATVLPLGFNRDADAYLAVQAVLRAYTNAKFPGSYKIAQKNGAVDVIPTQVLGASGVMREVTPIMSRPVTFPYADRSVLDTLQLIVDSASQAAGVRIKVLTVPFNGSERVALAATGQPARDELANLLAKVGGGPVSYQLLYEPSEGVYYFNLTTVPANTPESTTLAPPSTTRVPAKDNPFFIKEK